ncbi:hypothetical protein MIND_00971000 [Mycena indigotica]|uniref:Piwi domain-containing protein n=1 Tax=Mycena indigotica TaxID=2126181 RepID=A0A8H6SEN0_9AGAR|nr:uncharacterized protein MIND_00971000 [Mycena indigotica]KAF7297375.1 hypothetical protein MIND_00971000 [Mycena indigotica]
MVAGQSYKKRLPPSAIPAINKLAVLKPKDKLSRITGKTLTVESPIRTYGQSEVLVEAGVAVGTMPLTVPGRMLLSLPVEYANAVVTPRDGTWNVLDKKFRTAMEMPRWAVACFAPSMSMDDIVRTMRELAQCCAKLGMVFGHPDPQRSFVQGSGQNVRRKLYDICGENNKNSVDMIFVILPGNAADIRREVKYLGDVELGVRTQCLLVDKLPRPGDRNASQYYNNVALKLNTRLGGCNATVGGPILTGLKSDPFMIVGADVSHPSPGSSRPSVASLLWSHNKYATAYGCIRRLQPSRQEIIQDLEAMFVHALDSFLQGNALKRENGHIYLPPKRIFFYRDGVSEGQFAIVKDFEIAAVKAAIAQVWNQRGFNGRPFPLLTFLIVGKRHHVTFFPDGHYEIVEDRKTGNCKPGLVVDDALANPQYKDFYLLSHAAILGTSRCAHYTVLLDENFQEDVAKLEELSYALCHAYARATRSVSIPAPVYYADLACDHAKFHMDPNAMFDLESDASSTTGSVADASLEEWNKAFHDVHKNLAHTMYFL